LKRARRPFRGRAVRRPDDDQTRPEECSSTTCGSAIRVSAAADAAEDRPARRAGGDGRGPARSAWPARVGSTSRMCVVMASKGDPAITRRAIRFAAWSMPFAARREGVSRRHSLSNGAWSVRRPRAERHGAGRPALPSQVERLSRGQGSVARRLGVAKTSPTRRCGGDRPVRMLVKSPLISSFHSSSHVHAWREGRGFARTSCYIEIYHLRGSIRRLV